MRKFHTPGPWQAVAGAARYNVTTTDKPRSFNICAINSDRLEQLANALLIAAAPDYDAAARHAVEEASPLDADDLNGPVIIPREAFDELRAAIAKAEGRD